MKKEKLKSLLDGIEISDEQVEKIFVAVNKSINELKPDMEKLKNQLATDFEKDIFSKLGIEEVNNVDSLKAYAKKLNSSTDETKESLLRVEEELKSALEYKTKYEEVLNKNTKLERTTLFKGDVNDKYLKHAINEYNERYEALSKDNEEVDGLQIKESIINDYPEWANGYKKDKGNPLPKENKEEKDLVAQMAEALK